MKRVGQAGEERFKACLRKDERRRRMREAWNLLGFIAVVVAFMMATYCISTLLVQVSSKCEFKGFTFGPPVTTNKVPIYTVYKVVTNWPDEVVFRIADVQGAIRVLNQLNASRCVEY